MIDRFLLQPRIGWVYRPVWVVVVVVVVLVVYIELPGLEGVGWRVKKSPSNIVCALDGEVKTQKSEKRWGGVVAWSGLALSAPCMR